MVERAKIIEAVKAAKEKAPERKFSESVDITINLKNIDMAQPKNRIDETILLPHGIGKPVGVVVLGKGDITTQAKEAGVDLIIGPEEIERLGGVFADAGPLSDERFQIYRGEIALARRGQLDEVRAGEGLLNGRRRSAFLLRGPAEITVPRLFQKSAAR